MSLSNYPFRRFLERRLIKIIVAVSVTAALASSVTSAALLKPYLEPELEARYRDLAQELRCLVCQNQSLADSNAGLAGDLKREIRERLRSGASDKEIIRYLTDRYGDFVLYRPPLKVKTLVLWFGPLLLVFGAILVLIQNVKAMGRGESSSELSIDDQLRAAQLLGRSAPRSESTDGRSR